MPKEVPWWLSIVVGVAIVGATIIVDGLFDLFSNTAILLAIILVVLASIIGGIIARFAAGQQITKAEEDIQKEIKNLEEKVREVHSETKTIIDHSNTCQDCITSLNLSIQTLKQILKGELGESLITYEDLKQIEGSVNEEGEIWVLTSALQLEATELNDIIYKNFEKGIKYKYLIPSSDVRLQTKMITLAKKWQKDCSLSEDAAREQIQCYLVPDHFAYMTVIVYGPYDDTPTVLVKFPTSEFYEKEKYPLIYRVDAKPREAWKTFVDALQEMILDRRKCSLTQPLKIDFSKPTDKTRGDGK